MKRAAIVLPVLAAIVLLGVRISSAEGWSLPIWNPFAAKDAKPKAPIKPKPSSKQAEPSTLEKIGTGTKDAFTKTGEFLFPWTKSTPAKTTRPASTKKATESKSWLPFSSSQAPSPEPPPKNTADFLSLPRNKY